MEREKKPRKDREINPEKRKRMRNEKKIIKERTTLPLAPLGTWLH
jgi:hypothetical protein